jgi:transketolase
VRAASACTQVLDAGALPTLHDRYGISRQALGTRIKGWLG